MARREFSRSQRLGDQIHRELALLIESEIGDPRVKGVTITAVKLSRDLGYARVYFTTLEADAEHPEAREQAEQGLSKAAAFLRHRLSERLIARVTPRLSFVYDESIERGRHMEQLIRQVNSSDPAETSGD